MIKNFLSDRALIELLGHDRKKFLQGLITNDVYKASGKKLIFAVMLNAQGRFLYDFFIFEIGEKLMLDCLLSRREEIIKKLNFYKLRAQVEIKKNDEFLVGQTLSPASILQELSFPDPRHSGLGHRVYLKKDGGKIENLQTEIQYNWQRISLKIPESEHDLTYEKSFILEFGFDELNAIDYEKGCYVGQELTARTHFLGTVRKKIFHIKIPNAVNPNSNLKNSEITCEGKSAGLILSSVFHDNELNSLALIRLSDEQNLDEIKEKLEFQGQKISIVS